ncbi:MAG: hypothetical protein IJX53_00960 [Clostridia bacterium]|nr:hypothetical protein [Clostridia bacterium]
MQEQSTMYWKPKRSPVRRILLVLLIVQIICAEIVAGMYLYRLYSRPMGYRYVRQLVEEIDSERIAADLSVLENAGYVLLDESEYDYTYSCEDAMHSLKFTNSFDLLVKVNKHPASIEPMFIYDKKYTDTILPCRDGYWLFYADGYITLTMLTNGKTSPTLALKALRSFIDATAEGAESYTPPIYR